MISRIGLLALLALISQRAAAAEVQQMNVQYWKLWTPMRHERMRVELIYDADCPNVPATRSLLIQAFTKTGVSARWREWERQILRRRKARGTTGSAGPRILRKKVRERLELRRGVAYLPELKL